MKTWILLFSLFIVLATTGSSCLNEGFLVSVNLPANLCYDVNPGPTLAFAGSANIRLIDQIDDTYRENIKNARYYDIRVKVGGTYNGTITGAAFINGARLLDFTGKWSDFQTPQSLLSHSSAITIVASPAGMAELSRVMNSFPSNQQITVLLTGAGTLSGQSPVPPGLSACVELLAQVDSEVK